MPFETTTITAESAEAPDSAAYQLTVKRAVAAFLLYFGSQIVVTIFYSIYLGVRYGANNIGSGIQNGLVDITILSMFVGLAVIVLWTRSSAKSFGPAFAPQLGWQQSRYSIQQAVLLILGVYIAVLLFNGLYSEFVVPVFGEEDVSGAAEQLMAQLMETGSFAKIALFVTAAAVCAPILEEIVFRGYLQSALKNRMPVWGAVGLTSIVFAAVHGSIPLFPIYFILGIAMGMIYERTGSLRTAIGFHVFNNVMAFGLAFFIEQ